MKTVLKIFHFSICKTQNFCHSQHNKPCFAKPCKGTTQSSPVFVKCAPNTILQRGRRLINWIVFANNAPLSKKRGSSTMHELTWGKGSSARNMCNQAADQSQAAAQPQINSNSLTDFNCSGTVSMHWVWHTETFSSLWTGYNTCIHTQCTISHRSTAVAWLYA